MRFILKLRFRSPEMAILIVKNPSKTAFLAIGKAVMFFLNEFIGKTLIDVCVSFVF